MRPRRLKIALVAGEPSGDLLGAHLIQALKTQYPDAQFMGIGGPKMIQEGFESWFSMEILSVNGLVEVLKHYPAIARMRKQLIALLSSEQPDLFIGIDAPDFNLDLETILKKRKIKTVHYISPTIWAWRPERIHKIAKACDLMLVLFPFETPLYEKAGIPAAFVGHPMADEIPEIPNTPLRRQKLGYQSASHVFSLLPGSRQSEVLNHIDLLIKTAQHLKNRYPSSGFIIPAATPNIKSLIEEAICQSQAQSLEIHILDGHADDAIEAADVVITASGTATLETALWKKPMVIFYRINWLTWQIAKRLVKLKWVGLPNILCDEEVVPEFLQEEATPHNLSNAVIDWIEHPERIQALKERFLALHHQLRQNTSVKAANAIKILLGSSK